MASLVLSGDTSGSITLSAPAVAGTTTITLPTVSGGNFVVSDSSGNVGIGTTSPSYKLEVSGAIGAIFANPDVSGIVIQATTGTNAAAMKFNNTGGNFFVGKDSSSGARISGTAYANCVWGETAYPTIFGTNNLERMRIDSSGNVGIGVTAVDSRTHIYKTVSSGDVLRVQNASGSTGVAYVGFRYGTGTGTETGYIGTNGTTTSYNTSSDYRLKENIAPMTGALDRVAQLKPVTYKWKIDGSEGQGFIAHELQAVVPDCVTGEKDAVDEEGNPKYQGVDTSFLVATLTAAIQEQQTIINDLKARIETLESK